ncbi:MAG: hypothetical protein ABWK05_06965 [Pyrobaculum sp.]
MFRESYIQGLVQRRAKYRFDYKTPTTITKWLEEEFVNLARALEERWGGRLCRLDALPTLGLLLIEWHGGHLLADVSICAPLSHPAPPAHLYNTPTRRIDVCVEPIAPTRPPVEYVTLHIPGVKHLGRATLRNKYIVVKYRGLLFATSARHSPEPRGGVRLELGRYDCAAYRIGKALRLLKSILESRA